MVEIRERGWISAIGRLRKDVWSTNRWQVFACDRNKVIEGGALNPTLSVQLLTCADSGVLRELLKSWPREFFRAKEAHLLNQFRRRLESGSTCCILRQGPRIVAGLWLMPPDTMLKSFLEGVGNLDRVVTQAFVVKEFRGQGLFSPFLTAVLLQEDHASFERVYALVAPWNVRSARAFRRLGFVEVAEATVRTRWNVTRTELSLLPKFGSESKECHGP